MSPDRDQLIADVIALQRTLSRAFHASTGTPVLPCELTMAQLRVLIVLADDGPLAIGHVAERLGVGLPTASHLIDRLVRAELVDRQEDPADRRRMLARLTPAGEAAVDRLRQGGQERLRAWLSELADADLAALAQGIRALVVAAGATTCARPSLPDPYDPVTR